MFVLTRPTSGRARINHTQTIYAEFFSDLKSEIAEEQRLANGKTAREAAGHSLLNLTLVSRRVPTGERIVVCNRRHNCPSLADPGGERYGP